MMIVTLDVQQAMQRQHAKLVLQAMAALPCLAPRLRHRNVDFGIRIIRGPAGPRLVNEGQDIRPSVGTTIGPVEAPDECIPGGDDVHAQSGGTKSQPQSFDRCADTAGDRHRRGGMQCHDHPWLGGSTGAA
jgi:hypothetical protein